MASRKPTRRRTYLGLERLDDRVTPATLTLAAPGTSPSALTGAAFSAPSSGISPNLGNVVSFFPSLTAGATGSTLFNPTVATTVPATVTTPITLLTPFQGAFGPFGNTVLTTLGNTSLTTLGNTGRSLGGLNLTNPGLSLASGLSALPSTLASLTGPTTNLNMMIPSFTSGISLPVAATLPSVPFSSTVFDASTLPSGLLQTSLSPVIQGTSIAPAVTQSLSSTAFVSVPSAALTPTPVATPTLFPNTTSFVTNGNNVPMTATPFAGNTAALTSALSQAGATITSVAPFSNAVSFRFPISNMTALNGLTNLGSFVPA